MTQLISQRSGPKPAFLLLALLALVAAGLFGANQLGSSAQAQTTVPLHDSHEDTEHTGNTQTCPTPPEGQEAWYGWHFVLPSNEDFASLSVTFETAGTISAEPFPGEFVSHPDASHAYIWTETADTLVSGTSTTEATEAPAFFNLSGTCAPTVEPTEGNSSVTIVKQGLVGDDVASFTHDLDATGTFDLGGPNPTSVTFVDLEAGVYEVTELPLEGYVLESGGCQASTARTAPSLTALEGNTIGITLGEDQDLTCTFVNGPAQAAQHTVTVTKYIDDALATEGVFNLTSTWTAANLNGGVESSGNFTLEAPDWAAVTSLMDAGADYSVVENGIDATCEGEDAYSLAGYGIGDTLVEAAAAEPVEEAAITDLQTDMHIVVFNETCAQHTVTVTKYIDDALATEGVFNLTSTWTAANLNGGVQTSGNFTLEGPDWTAVTSLMAAGADYSVVENGIDATCSAGDDYRLVGYGVGATLAEAAATVDSATVGAITDLDSNMHIVVFNEPCESSEVEQVRVTTAKYLDGAAADEGSFDILFTWTADNFNGGVQDSTTIALSSANTWVHASALMDSGADFSVAEANVDATCSAGDDYRLVGYGVGDTLAEAAGATPVPSAELTNITSDQFIVVFNATCQYSVTTVKYLGDEVAAEGSFDILFTWTADNFNAGLEDSTTIALGPVNTWMHASALMDAGADFSVEETNVDATCEGEDDYMLVGYGVGATLAEAAATVDSATIGAITDLDSNMYIVVFNEPCVATGSIVLTKLWDGEDTGPNAVFALSDNLPDTDGTDDASVTLIDDGGNDDAIFSDLEAGTYTFDEADIPDWDVTAITCEGVATAAVSNLADGTLSVTLADGENALCTYTNTPDEDDEPEPGSGSILLTKLWAGETAGPNAVFTLSANLGDADNSLTLTDDGANDDALFIDLGVGTFTFAEQDIAGWDVTAITCTGIPAASVTANAVAGTLSVTLADGQTASCTFTNAAATAVSPFFPELPNTNVPQPSVIIPNQPGVVSPNMPNQPGVVSPNIPNQPGVVSPAPSVTIPNQPGVVSPEQPSVNIPNQPGVVSPEQPSVNIPNQPGVVSDSPLPSSADTSNNQVPQSNVAGAQQPAPQPPSAGNTSNGNSDAAALGLWLVLAMLAGATGAVVYRLRGR